MSKAAPLLFADGAPQLLPSLGIAPFNLEMLAGQFERRF